MRHPHFAPAATFGILAATSASAQIAYSGLLDLTISTNSAPTTLYFDLNQSSGTLAQNGAFAGADFQLGFQTPSAEVAAKPTITPQSGDAQVGTKTKPILTETLVSANNLSSGSLVNSSGGFSGDTHIFQSPGWSSGVAGYLPLQLGSNYGWAGLTYTRTSDGSVYSLTLHDFAFASGGEQITAGQTTIPEPSTYAVLTGLLAGSAALYARRRKRAA